MADVIIQDGNINWKIRDLRKMNFPTQASNIEGACWIEYDDEGNPVLKMYHNGKVVDVSSGDESLMTEQDKANLDSIFHQTSTTYKVGDQVHVAEFPSYYVLECITAGTTSSNRPNFSSIDIEASPSSTSEYEYTNNKINSISINGNVIEPDSSKNVNIDLSNYTTNIKDNIGDASSTNNGLMSSSDKSKLDGITISDYAKKTDLNDYTKTTELKTAIGNASSTNSGLMSAADKSKLDNLSTSSSSETSSGEDNKIENIAVNGTDLEITDKRVNIDLSNYTPNIKNNIGNASTSKDGLMSSSDKSKLDGIASNAEVNKIDSISVNGTNLSINSKNVNIPLFNSSTDGAVPKSDGSLSKFLRADGEWVEIKREPNETPVLLFDKSNIVLNKNNLTETVTITTNSDGEITVLNSNDKACTVNYDNDTKKITITAVHTGESTIGVSISSSETYKSISSSIDITITGVISPILDENTVEEIVQAARDGTASTLWPVGDVVNVKLNGTLGSNILDNLEVGLQIIGFNHNAEIEGNNTIHFQCGCINDKPIALYWDQVELQPKHHNTTITTTGGWEQSDLRTIICPQFYNCLPQEWQNVIQTTTKYTDNVGNGNDNSEEAVTTTQDKVFLLAEYEVFGSSENSNSYEKNKQQQYEYYINGTPYSTWNIRQRAWFNTSFSDFDDIQGYTAFWWLRSPCDEIDFCNVGSGGETGICLVDDPLGFAPAFAIS